MVKYATMKNAELENLLKERGLPHTGKKAEMVARLEEHDSKKNEDEIDWDDDAADVPSESVKPAETAAPGAEAESAPAAEESKTEELDVKESAAAPETTTATEAGSAPAPQEAEAPKIDYSIGIAKTDAEKEIEARKKRMERFGVKPEEQDASALDAQKRLERQKKFGDAATETDKLDSALSEKRKRGRENGDERGDFKRGRGRGGRNRGGPPRRDGGGGGGGGGGGRDGDRDRRAPKEQRSDRGSNWMSADDRAAAEKRKARWV